MATKAERLLKKARAQVKKGKTKKALSTYRDACKHDPHQPEIWLERAATAQAMDVIDEAAESLFCAADLYARGGVADRAAEIAAQVLELDPKHRGALRFVRMVREKAEARAKKEAEARAKQEAEARAKKEAEERATKEAEARATKAARAKEEAEARAKEEAEARATKEAEARAKEEAEAQAATEEASQAEPAADTVAAAVAAAVAKAEADAVRDARARAGADVDTRIEAATRSDERTEIVESLESPRAEHVMGRVTGQLALGELSLSEMISPPGETEIPLDDEQNLKILQAVAATVSTSPLLSELDSDLVRYLIECGSVAHVRAGQPVFVEGEAGSSLYLILGGKVLVEREKDGAVKRLATLRRGAFFGEMGLLTDTPRTATIRALETCTLLVVSRKAVRGLIEREPRVLKLLMRFFRARLVGTLLATSPLFKPFSAEERRALVTRFRLRELEADSVVIERGAPSDGLYMVLMGSLIALLPDEDRVLGTLGAGEAFGEMSLLDGAEAMATIRTESRAWVLRLPREDFEELAADHPELRSELTRLATSRREQNRDNLSAAVRLL